MEPIICIEASLARDLFEGPVLVGPICRTCRVGLMGAPDVDDGGMGKAREAACDREVVLAVCKGYQASK